MSTPPSPVDIKDWRKYVTELITSKDSPAKFMLAGGVSGAVSRTCAAPFERLKILFQVQDVSSHMTSNLNTDAAQQGKKYKSIISGLMQIGKDEGYRGYFKGNGTNIVRVVPYTAAQFLSYEKYKQYISTYSSDGSLSVPQRLLCGGLAGMTSVIVSYPLDVVRCRLSAQQDRIVYKGIGDALVVIFKQEGISGLYRGLVPTLYGIAPYVALNFTLYERLKFYAMQYQKSEDLGIVMKLGLGAVSGTVAQTITYPFDVVRRRMQMLGYGGQKVAYTSMTEGFKHVYKKYGFFGFYKGLVPNYLKVIPVVSINFIVYEYMKKFLGLSGGGKEV
ncbi:mitochondrial substrate carrier family protein B [Acrasis kona]|uniref:Mitochondrial substrate carrier family protein B n=1 Tax=Acrasis kona TaxID=1008807 RepID=A0AAW2ZJ07_9EUKA